MITRYRLVIAVILSAATIAPAMSKPRQNAPAEPVVLKEALAIGPVGRYGRSPIVVDALQKLIVSGEWNAPVAGDGIVVPGRDPEVWTEIKADDDGWFRDARLRGGYAAISVVTDAKRIVLLEAVGHGMVYVNGEPRPGDPYRRKSVRLPIMLRRGQNWLIFNCGRGEFRARLVTPGKPVMLDPADAIIPDLRLGEATDALGSIMVINATASWQRELTLSTSGAGLPQSRVQVPAIPPLSVREVPFKLSATPPNTDPVKAMLTLCGEHGDALHEVEIEAPVRSSGDSYRVTFRSAIDDSVQYYAVKPAVPIASLPHNQVVDLSNWIHGKDAYPGPRPPDGESPAPALFVSLHGAGVEALGQVNSYAAKSWGHIVAPTNRRPFGFDWEDWGRLDALEVLSHAQLTLKTDPRRTYLTGHSMGGHGTWSIGALFPDKFAAIGPSAGWISFYSYTGAGKIDGESTVADILRRAARASDTLTFLENYAQQGIYILHGDADDNVPVSQAREMRDKLAEFHRDFQYHEEPGQGHWWNVLDDAGTDCVDWAPMFDMFARRRMPAGDEVRELDFTTINPEVSASCHWVTIWAQQRAYEPSNVKVRFDPWKRRFVGTTQNVAVLMLSFESMRPGKGFWVELDGQRPEGDWSPPSSDGCVWLAREGDKWCWVPRPSAAHKSPRRSGPFKHAFNNRFVFVIGTQGSDEENAWALAKARYDAESFWYRGNGSVDTVLDSEFDPDKFADRSVILYGNADTNAVWSKLLGDCPVVVKGDSIRVGTREFTGGDLATLFVYPRADSGVACVGVVGGSGIAGMRLATRLPYFVSGVAYPDCTVLGPEMLEGKAGGVRAAGFFGVDWSVGSGEFAWADEAQ